MQPHPSGCACTALILGRVRATKLVVSTTAIRDLVAEECRRETNRFGACFFEQHLEQVVGFGCRLADRLGGDREIVTLAGYLHDLGAVRDFACLQDHHLQGARVAREILSEHGCSGPTVDAVCACIESHSAPVQVGRGSIEQVCISNADVLSHIARPAYWFHYLYRIRGMSYADGLTWMRLRVGRSWEGLTPEARSLAADEHAAAVRFLEVA